jgi:D-glycero-alpha-D-manno-heptose 1-phosphate guanylyltransferase
MSDPEPQRESRRMVQGKMRPYHVPLTAMILVGGLGTRLRPVVSDRPKPMAMVQNVPFLEILVNSLAKKGVKDFVLLTGYRAEIIEDHFLGRSLNGLTLRISHEEFPLGTGGAVKHAAEFASDPSLLVNGDTFFDADIKKLCAFHEEMKGEVTLSLMAVDDVRPYGSVCLDEDGMITGFIEKGGGSGGPGLINGGLSLLSRGFIAALPDDAPYSMEQDIFPSLAREGKMFGLFQDRPFFDIGTPESYRAFERFVQQHRDLLP